MTRKIPYWKNKTLENLYDIVDGIFYVEEWKPIERCEKEYHISTFGRIKSLKRDYVHPIKGVVCVKEKILSQRLNNDGYCKCQISIGRIKMKVYVHRLVGTAFIPNPQNKLQINHKFGINDDNFFTHIEWNTNSENNLHAFANLGRMPSRSQLGKSGKLHHSSKSVYCPTLGIGFDSARIASKQLGVSQGSISHVCNNKRTHVGGMVFNYCLK